ncbi:hypothetical protein [Plantactinospora sp. CA-290183]|uniref:hypothetical protein n=1 Tax=Plantactinospora sp. CA-290183 TaxID=3240006 RepID=UPI003D927DB2
MTTTPTPRRLLGGVLGGALAVLAAASAAQAAPAAPTAPSRPGAATAAVTGSVAPRDAAVSVGRLVFEPTDRGHLGSLPVTVTYRGTEPGYLNLTVVEPVAGSFEGLTPNDACLFGWAPDGRRRSIHCGVPDGALAPGERRSFTVDFWAPTAPRDHAMSLAGGEVSVYSDDPADGVTKPFDTLFRSTTGSLRNPRPYVQDTETDATVTAGTARLLRQADGSYAGRLPVTIRYAGDAGNDFLSVDFTLPDGVQIEGIEPTEVCAGNWCAIPGDSFAAGEERTVELLFSAPTGTTAGQLGTGTLSLTTSLFVDDIPDVDPSDNTASFDVDAVDAA